MTKKFLYSLSTLINRRTTPRLELRHIFAALFLIFAPLTTSASFANSISLVTVNPNQSDGWVVFANDDTRQWVSDECRGRLESNDIQVVSSSWTELAEKPRVAGSSWTACDDLVTMISMESSASAFSVLTQDDQTNGWVIFSADNTKQWVSPACRTQLAQAGANVVASSWAEIGPRPVVDQWRTCDQIAELLSTTSDPGDNSGGDPTSAVLSIFTQSGREDGWVVLSADNSKQWIPASCRAHLIQADANIVASSWADIGPKPITDQWRTCEALVALIGGGDGPMDNPPSISLVGANPLILTAGDLFNDPGATADDREDGDLTNNIETQSNVNTAVAGSYVINYQITDSNGQQANVDRNVQINSADSISRQSAIRFLQRATFGFTDAGIAELTELGYEDWINQQIDIEPTLLLPGMKQRMIAVGYNPSVTHNADDPQQDRFTNHKLRTDEWFSTVVKGDDQLRQRVAFALSQIFVVSFQNGRVGDRPQGLTNYYDLLIGNSFGNYRDLIEDVTLSPIMGHYLSMRRNSKARPDENIVPDENFAREILQLFSIGLHELNTDGTVKTDSNGNAIPSYDQDTIYNFARVFTGWNYGNVSEFGTDGDNSLETEMLPMRSFDDFHDQQAKTLLLGLQVPAGNSADEDLEIALDNIFNHPNVGPFIGKQLIHKLVTSNPSPQYVYRVASVFDDNGDGVRGDLAATVRAVLLDPEALSSNDGDDTFGKLKEPIFKFTNLWRAFDVTGIPTDRFRFTDTNDDFDQELLRSPSVFNFFKPSYSPPGEIKDQGLIAPEFEIFHESTAIGLHNELFEAARSGANLYRELYGAGGHQVKNQVVLDTDYEATLAADTDALVDHLVDKIIGEPIAASSRNAVAAAIDDLDITGDEHGRVINAIYFLLMSREFAVQR